MSAALQAVLQGLKYIPASLGVKALTKVNPKFKNFFTEAASYGVDATRAIDYLTDRFSNKENQRFEGQLDQRAAQGTIRPDEAVARSEIGNSQIPGKLMKGAAGFGAAGLVNSGREEQQTPQQQSYDPISALSKFPPLMQFIQREAKDGGNAASITSKARKNSRLREYVNVIEQEIGEPFEGLLGRLIGGRQEKPQGDQQAAVSPSMQALLGAIQQYKSSKGQ